MADENANKNVNLFGFLLLEMQVDHGVMSHQIVLEGF